MIAASVSARALRHRGPECRRHGPRPQAGGRKQATVRVGHDVALAPMDLLCGVAAFEPPFRSAVLTVWLSMMAAEGEASRPARSRSAMTGA